MAPVGVVGEVYGDIGSGEEEVLEVEKVFCVSESCGPQVLEMSN